MHDLIRTILAAALVLGVLVFVHELGHYLAARWRGVHVEAFSIGFGRPILRWVDRVGTEWRLCALPIGGYVMLHGVAGPEDTPDDVRAAWRPGQTFHDKPVWHRFAVIAAGPLFSILLAIPLFAAVFLANGRPPDTSEIAAMPPIVGDLMPGGPGAKAGLQVGDRVLSVDGKAVATFGALQRFLSDHPGRSIHLAIAHGDETRDVPVTLGSVESDGHKIGQLGVVVQMPPSQPVGIGEALVVATRYTWMVMVSWVAGFWKLVTGHVAMTQLSGTLHIAQMSGQSAAAGAASLVTFMALLSINLGMVNLLPIPVLDGGRLMFITIEALRGRPVSRTVQLFGLQAGMAMVATIFVFAMFNDLNRFGLFGWLRSLVG